MSLHSEFQITLTVSASNLFSCSFFCKGINDLEIFDLPLDLDLSPEIRLEIDIDRNRTRGRVATILQKVKQFCWVLWQMFQSRSIFVSHLGKRRKKRVGARYPIYLRGTFSCVTLYGMSGDRRDSNTDWDEKTDLTN